MKNVKYILNIAVISITLLSCKKGENDPFMSLSSRKARITGEWKMSAMDRTYSNSYTNNGSTSSYSNTSTFDGTTKTSTSTNNGIVSPSTTTIYSEEYTFEKDGTFKNVATQTSNGETYTYTYEGNWAFLGKNKNADVKKKEAILLSYSGYSDSDGENASLTGTFYSQEVLIIDQLKNKEIVFKYDETSTYTDFNGLPPTSSTSTNTAKGSMTFVAK